MPTRTYTRTRTTLRKMGHEWLYTVFDFYGNIVRTGRRNTRDQSQKEAGRQRKLYLKEFANFGKPAKTANPVLTA